ncbi:MAG: choice-of-anchor D domain-containing protein [Nitrospinae bacterium]|nr:choice-of-anchor D domain-containing protein [Nitrospinota bacterium]
MKVELALSKGIRCLAILSLALALTVAPAHATTFTVNDTGDAHDANPGDNICATATSVCTLRAAIDEVNMAAGGHTIVIPSGTYTITGALGDDLNVSGDYDIRDSVTITGVGGPILDGGALDRVFHITGAYVVSITGVTIQNGNSGTGGGIYNPSGTVTISSSTISGNTAAGIWNSGTATISSSTITGNNGSGIYNSGTMTLTNATISGNQYTVSNGGGVIASAGSITFTNCTITNNSSITADDGVYRTGGNITFNNTIIANNGDGNDCTGIPGGSSTGYNLDSDNTCNLTAGTDIPGSALANLGALADNGGSTQTHALLTGSAAIDAGDCNGGAVTTDQRAAPRPYGSACDIGAYEYGAVASASGSSSSASPTAGCTDYHATNFNPAVSIDDGSCIFPDPDLGDVSQSVSFGPVAMTRSSTQTIVIENGGPISTYIYGVDISGSGFTIVSDTCTNQPVIPGRSCEIVVSFNPGAEGGFTGSLEVWTNNAKYYPLTIALSGSSSGLPPTEPALMAPGDGETITGTSVTLQWTPGQAPDGGPVTNKVYICESADFTGCSEPAATARSSGAAVPAAFVVVMGLLAPLGMRTRRGRTLMIAFMLVAGSAFASCGGGSSKPSETPSSSGSMQYTAKGLKANTTYYWKVATESQEGASSESAVYSFTTGG